MKKFLILLFCVIQLGYGQTKLIAHKSHSGTSNTFHLAIDEITNSDFGLRPNYQLKDSIEDIEKLLKSIKKVDISKKLKKDSVLVEKVISNNDSLELKSSNKNLQELEKNKQEEKEIITIFKANNHQPPFDNKMIYVILIGIISIIIGMIYKVLTPKFIKN